MAKPLIEAADTVSGGSNSALSSWSLNYPAYGNGDLILFNLASDGSVTHGTLPGGPNGESAVTILGDQTGNPTVSVWYFIGSATTVTGSVTITPSAAEQHAYTTAIVPDGEFDATTPIDSSGTRIGNSGSEVSSAAFTATAGVTDGLLVNWSGVDVDPIIGTPTGWTDIAVFDRGAIASLFSGRDAVVTTSESIASAHWTIANDSSRSITYVINGPAAAGGITIPVLMNSYRQRHQMSMG